MDWKEEKRLIRSINLKTVLRDTHPVLMLFLFFFFPSPSCILHANGSMSLSLLSTRIPNRALLDGCRRRRRRWAYRKNTEHLHCLPALWFWLRRTLPQEDIMVTSSVAAACSESEERHDTASFPSYIL